MSQIKRYCAILLLPAIIIIFNISTALAANNEAPKLNYTIKVADIEKQLFHVTLDINNFAEESVDVSLPIWTPGWYTIENYAKNILRFTATNDKGAHLPLRMVHKQTWRIACKDTPHIKIEFDYLANIFALNQAKITKDFAFFTGTQLFLQVEKYRQLPATINFQMPADWKIISALNETSDPLTFTTTDYDALVDSVTEMGNFDLTKFEVDGKPHFFASTPAGSFSADKRAKLVEDLKKVVHTESAIFGEQPYDKYVYFYFFMRPESNASGALEHLNSHVLITNSVPENAEDLIDTAAHEFFHVWNVKRIRPQEMWPYDYSRENETPLLWVSEGFTSYYSLVALFRSGLIDRDSFIKGLGGTITNFENTEASHYISPSASSISTWLGYDAPAVFSISYYTQGMNLAALLDISMRVDSKGEKGLDDLFRLLYTEHYKKGRGFTMEELINALNRLTGSDYHPFFRKYVDSVEPLPYETIYQAVGYNLTKKEVREPVLGIFFTITAQGQTQISNIIPASSAFDAGLRINDIIYSIDDIQTARNSSNIYQHLLKKMGDKVIVKGQRAGKDFSLEMKINTRNEDLFELNEDLHSNSEALKLRSLWLQQNQNAATAKGAAQ